MDVNNPSFTQQWTGSSQDADTPQELQQTSSAPSGYSLFSNPPSLVETRQRLFDLDETLEIPFEDFNIYFPYVDNVYTSLKSHPSITTANSTTDYYPCRIRPSQHATSNQADVAPSPPGEEAGAGKRRKRQKLEHTCSMIMKVTTQKIGLLSQCTIERADPDIPHTHDLDFSDGHKRCSAIMEVARREVCKAYTPLAVFDKMNNEERDKMIEAGGKFMKPSDVRNVSIKWRAVNPNMPLKTYDGQELKPRQRKSNNYNPANGGGGEGQAYVPLIDLPADTLRYPAHARTFLEEYLPSPSHKSASDLPHITLTYATSLDARLSVRPGAQTVLSGPESKAMTHYLRSRHDGILIGVGTALADDPSLNCRVEGVGGYGAQGLAGQPRPIIIDPHGRLSVMGNMKVLQLARAHRGRAPWIVVTDTAQLQDRAVKALESYGGKYVRVRQSGQPGQPSLAWYDIFTVLGQIGIQSVIVEGGGVVLSELLRPQYRSIISSVIITIAPTFLGHAGTMVAPDTYQPTGQNHQGQTVFAPVPNRVMDVKWQPMGSEDVILCGRLSAGLDSDGNGEDTTDLGPGILDGIEEVAEAEVPNGHMTH